MEIFGETHFDVTRDNVKLHIEAPVVKDQEVEFRVGIPFMSNNDISMFPVKHEIMVEDSHFYNYYSHTVLDTRSQYNVNRTQAHVL